MQLTKKFALFAGTCILSSGSWAQAQTTGVALKRINTSNKADAVKPAPAEQSAPASATPEQQQEIVVTAQKRSERLQDVPMSIRAIAGNKLTAEHATTLEDIVNRVPGVTLVSNGPASNQLVIRGLTVGASVNSNVATYVDEVPYTSIGPFSYSANLAPNFDTYDLARVEVLRGPQGTLYGASALGGLLKYVTNAPDPAHFSASFLGGLSDVAHSGETGWEAHGMVNAPLGNTAALRVVGYGTEFPGFVDDPARGAQDINTLRRYGGRASLLWNANPDLKIRLSAEYQHIEADDNNTVDLNADTLRGVYGGLTQERALAESSTYINQVYNGTVDWNLGFGNLVSSTSYTKADPFLINDLSKTYGPFLQFFLGVDAGAAVTTKEPVHGWTHEMRIASHQDQPLEWLAGVYFTDQKAHETQALVPVDLQTAKIDTSLTPELGTFFIDSTYREYAGFGDLTYHVTPAFQVGVGGRYSNNKQTYHQVNHGILVGDGDFSTRSSEGVFTYSADVKYNFSSHMMAYGRIATGF
ncbi:MAG TPA: TonB-dependent receptor, partial [Sphingomicrobium sp.]|nr:TonB-dependent receptor [Sphingomicrobium sp.]